MGEIAIIEAVLGRAQQGVTEPFICRGDDGAIYFIKGREAGRRGQVYESISFSMIRKMSRQLGRRHAGARPARRSLFRKEMRTAPNGR